ncbi:MAG: GNAT family N-acetyltransferase [Ruminococcus sp.]|nr:GNAT family N-acetyltransferase [Ruminococcus sp.]MDY4909812.1 GNAT family N-acetyltransferase [Candidatus Fimenecus sp.]
MEIRHATKHDISAISEVEAKCFPPSEAASEKAFTGRIENYGNHFWLMYENDKLIAFVDGFVTDESDLTDEMFADATMHNENGAWQMIFGVNTLPEYRNNGYASELLRRAVDEAKEQGRKGVVLTCKDKLLPFYARLGFVDEGVTDKSTHGNAVWHQMRIIF